MTCSAPWSRPPAPKKRKKSSLHRPERGFGDAGAVTGSELVDAGDFTQDVGTLGCIVERRRPNRLEASTNACRRVYRNAVDDPTCLAGPPPRGPPLPVPHHRPPPLPHAPHHLPAPPTARP